MLLLLSLLWLAGPVQAAAGCAGPALQLQPLAPQAWLLQAADGDSEAGNRGHVASQLLAMQGGRLWLIGAGPSPAWARALDCQLRQRFGRGVDEVVVPWARGEQALGWAGHRSARRWAHAEVAAAMARQCPVCLENLRQALGAAAADLGAAPIRRPQRLLQGPQGRWGPWQWWALSRGDGQTALVWRLHAAGAAPLWAAPGWLWAADTPPDARSGDVAALLQGSLRLQALAAADGAAARWVGEQGGVQDAQAPQRAAQYWAALQQAADAALARGELLPAAPPPLQDTLGLPAAWLAHPRHALNWQRAARQAEDRLFAPPR